MRSIHELRYAALSYCWGKGEFVKLTSKNFQTYKAGLPMKEILHWDLPNTFQDAFDVTLALGLKFIWIDALCIMQDSADDWEREASLMQSVYGNSYNIAASLAKNVHGRLFLRPEPPRDRIRAQAKTNGRFPRVKAFYRPVESSGYHLAVENSHLMTRGWAIRENMLSPRTLHFGDRGVFWECRDFVGCESDHNTRAKDLSTRAHKCLVCGEVTGFMSSLFWTKILERYCAANFTFQTDKFTSHSGVAQTYWGKTRHSYIPHSYIAGMWLLDILTQLCWIPSGQLPTRQRPESGSPDWIAPSWLWASIEAGISYTDLSG